MKTSDWASKTEAKVLLIGENSTLQWKDEIIPHAMFLDYFFQAAPYDLGERSRYSEAKLIFEYLYEMTNGQCLPEQVYGALLTNELLARSPKGKHILVPEYCAKIGIERIKEILAKNPTIEYVFVMGMQANYYLQKFGFYGTGDSKDKFVKAAEPRRVGAQSEEPYYQPVDAKPFRDICFKMFDANEFEGINVIPILPIKSYPLRGVDADNFGENYENLIELF